jgi:hypothetical protein
MGGMSFSAEPGSGLPFCGIFLRPFAEGKISRFLENIERKYLAFLAAIGIITLGKNKRERSVSDLRVFCFLSVSAGVFR